AETPRPRPEILHRPLLWPAGCRLGLLRARRARPRDAGADKRHELAPPHSITSSARASNDCGTVRPNAFAVPRLIDNRYFVGACTGSSAGFVPLRMRST